ncbi:hypothetical protein [Tropicibacter oceani]|uniref:Lipoprotein n=1 Tax=Tropicibacter oceani TaxID=3058420 RepID=A0ABY8QHB9_9RHOB|nr:hypothetical protein [Tropicibacter oceani]WGW03925.1 hypothetical protein QF118_18725 [Tropicibacter oceani]
MKVLSSKLGAFAALALLAACGSGQGQVYFAQQNGQWVEISSADYAALQGGATPVQARPAAAPFQPETLDPTGELREAIARNPYARRTDTKLSPDSAPDVVADVSLEIALDLCNIPEGTRLTATTPCNL